LNVIHYIEGQDIDCAMDFLYINGTSESAHSLLWLVATLRTYDDVTSERE